MQIGIVGSGFVGSTLAYALVMRGVGRRIVLVDKDEARAKAEASDVLHAVPFANPLLVESGDYADLADCKIVVIAAGVSQQPGETRLELLQRNAAVFEQVVPAVLRHAKDAVLLIATNPVDVMTHVAATIVEKVGSASTRVFGSGTTLDTARFRSLLGAHFGVDARHVHAHVVGEHGDSEVLTWTSASIGGLQLEEFSANYGVPFDAACRDSIDENVRRAAYQIINGKGATYYGIASALAHIVSTVLHNQRSILTVCSLQSQVEGVKRVTISIPQLVGGQGVLSALPLNLSDAEHEKLARSAAIIREATDSIGY